ncbi:MAG TPA: hypothetical protein VFS21_36735, partial [Roseiflexaceae bacterium]|nr:hypothetical protein [Roseiflexaceae bacterium]
ARAGEIERSLALVHLIEDVDECVRVLGEVVEVLAQTKKVEVAQVYDVVVKAEEAAYSIKGGWICANVLNLTTKAKIKLGYTELARLSLEEAIKAANSIEDTVDRSIALAELTGLQFQLGEANMGRLTAGESIQSAQSIEDNEYRTYALRMITETLAHFGKVEEVLILKNLLEETEGRSWGLRMASEAYARAGVIDTALDFARLIEGADERSWVLMDIFESLLHIGETDMGKEIINESIEAARAIEDTFSRASTLWYVVEKLTSSGLAVEVGCLATESLSYLESLSSFERLFLLEQVGSTLGKTPHHSITFSLLHDHWSNLIRRDEFIVLLPAVASLLVAKPPLLQELLDGFEWVDQVLKKW